MKLHPHQKLNAIFYRFVIDNYKHEGNVEV